MVLAIMSMASDAFGQTLPDVKVENARGEEIRIRSLVNGKPLIISYWSIACKPCIQELNAINDVIEEWREEADFDVVAVSVDDVRMQASAKAKATALGWDFICIYDTNQELKRAMNVNLTPQSFVVDAAGNIYDQFGNGLIFRSYEDRQLGLNNSLEGVRAAYDFAGSVSIKGMYGRPRLYTGYAGSWVRGLDLNVSIADIFGWDRVMLNLEGSYVNRYESLDKDASYDFYSLGLDSPQLNMFSAGIDFAWKGLSLKGEYARKGKDLPTASSMKAVKGAAVFAEAVYSYKSFSVSGTFRILDDMGTMLSLYGNGTGNTLNYLPSLTRQYTYMLANLNPYQVNVTGETAGQADIYYSLRSKTDRHRYWNFHANFSMAYTLNPAQSVTNSKQLLWNDINADIERQWNRKLKTVLLFSRQEWSPSHGAEDGTYVSNIFVGDITYKFDRKKSLRAEIQYLLSGDYEGDWAAALLEFSFAPKWSIFASDMYNLEGTKKNYYNAGFSYTKGKTRIQLSYGRNRAGYICSGGVCRYSPAYTGLNLALTTSF